MLNSQDRIVHLASRLIACRSVTPTDDGAQEIVCAVLRDLGFSIFPIVEGNSRAFWAERMTSGPLFAFSGHTDVVPPGDLSAWTHGPFTPIVKDGKLFGRGVVDMKGNIAAFLVAIEEFLHASSEPTQLSLGVMIAGDEEAAPNRGTLNIMEYLQASGRKIDYCLVTEPTSSVILGDTVKIGRRGSASGKIIIRGIQGHSAYPENCLNPIHRSFGSCQEIAAHDWNIGNSADSPQTTLHFTSIHAGTGANNVIPGSLEASFNVRFSPSVQAEQVHATIQEILERHSLDFRLEWEVHARPFICKTSALSAILDDSIHHTTGVRPSLSTSGGTSDARFIAPFCSELVEFGLVGKSMHGIDEHADIQDLVRLKDIYKTVLCRLGNPTAV